VWHRWSTRGRENGGRWATRQYLRRLKVSGAVGDRLVVGDAHGSLRAVERCHSLLVFGPTDSFKTTGLAIPAILRWQGVVVATSVKDDLLASTLAARSRVEGRVQVFDPTEQLAARDDAEQLPVVGWSPLSACHTWCLW